MKQKSENLNYRNPLCKRVVVALIIFPTITVCILSFTSCDSGKVRLIVTKYETSLRNHRVYVASFTVGENSDCGEQNVCSRKRFI